jgi:hypothetical protein
MLPLRYMTMIPLRYVLLACCTLSLAACGSSTGERAKEDMMDSKAEYKDCISDNSDEIGKCDGARISYETDVKTLETLRGQKQQ